MKFLYIWKCPWIGSKLTLRFIHTIHGISLIYSLQMTTINYLKRVFTHHGVLIFNKLSSEIIIIQPIMIEENLIWFLDWKELLLIGRIYNSGFSTRELWMKKDKLGLDVSWLWYVAVVMLYVLYNDYSMLDAFWLLFVVWDVCQIGRLRSFAMYPLYLVILYLLICLDLYLHYLLTL
jgi:hypothetical protein